MTKCGVVSLLITASLITAAALSGLGTAQTSQARSSSTTTTKGGSDPLQTATKPLTPKSAMPAQRKSSVAVPSTSAGSRNTSKELTHLEHQKIGARGSKSASKAPG